MFNLRVLMKLFLNPSCFLFAALVVAASALGESEGGDASFGTLPNTLQELSEEHQKHPEIAQFYENFAATWKREIDAEAVPSIEKLRQNYLNAINDAREKARREGDLPTTLAFTKERDQVSSGEMIPLPDPDSAIQSLQNLREIYHRSNRKIMDSLEEKRESLLEAFAKAANDLSVELTRKDKLDAAIAATELKQIAETELKVFAEATVDLPTKPAEPAKKLTPIELPVVPSDDHLKSYQDLTKLLPLGFELNTDGELDLEKMERLNLGLRPQRNRIARWLFTLDRREPSLLYGGTERMISTLDKVEIGKREFKVRVHVHHAGDEDFAGKKKGNTFEVVGRVAFCTLLKNEGGILRLDIANARHQKPADVDAVIVEALPEIRILSASWGSGGSRMNVRDLIQEKLVHQHNTVWASRGSMEGDPAPYWQKNLAVSFAIGDQKASLSRHEGSALSFEDLFRAVLPPEKK